MSMQICYFSGTGNSLHVARELNRRLPGATLVPMVGALNDGCIETQADTIGVVFPIHNLSIPVVVRQFLQQVDLTSAGYIFAISTRLCLDRVFSDIDRILAKQGKSLDASFAVEMPCTYTPMFEIPPREDIAVMEAELQRRLDEIQVVVGNKQANRQKDEPWVAALGRLVYPVVSTYMRIVRFPDMARSFYWDSKCTGCGVCEKVCLSGRIKLVNGKPEWMNHIDCSFCFACLHYCPAQAVQLRGRKTDSKARYHHSQVNAADIAAQKHWQAVEDSLLDGG